MNTKRIVVVDDNTLLREGICLMINSDEKLEVDAEAEDGLSAVRTIFRLSGGEENP
jgi:chemotaxis response regulator CheB